MAAVAAQRYDGRYVVADKTTFTACNICKDDPDNPPLWQVRAKQIVHDNVEHNLYYHDATLDFIGVPVAYTPYLSGPDPTVERRQGFLSPTPGDTPILGPFVKVPYYFDIAPDADAILAPTFSQQDGLQMAGELRKRFENGSMQFDGSFTHADLISDTGTDEGEQWRGHLFGNFLYDINNVWRAGTDVAFASDKSYLPRYLISSSDQLTNRAYVEGLSGRDYGALSGYYFEDLRPGTQPVQPTVMPSANFNLMGEPGQTFGGRWSLAGKSMITSRDNANQDIWQQGPDTRMVGMTGDWQRQFISHSGLVTNITGLLHADTYSADNVIPPDSATGTGFDRVLLARQFEQGTATLRYPVTRTGDGYQQLVEPIVAVTAAPAFHNSAKQPIEDSTDITFDETNLFAPNRFTGWDLIEGGSRVVYGLRQTLTGENGERFDVFGGQSYDFERNSDFPALSGLGNHASNYVGRINFVPAKWIDMNYGFSFDQKDFSPERQDARISVGAPIFRPNIRYIAVNQTETNGVNQTPTSDVTEAEDTGAIGNTQEMILGFDSPFRRLLDAERLLHAGFLAAAGPAPVGAHFRLYG